MPDVLKIPPGELFGLLAAIGFAAGLNLYATVEQRWVCWLALDIFHIPPGLQLLESWPIIAASEVLLRLSFSPIPGFRPHFSECSSHVHPPYRVPAYLPVQGDAQLSPEHQLLAGRLAQRLRW